jgi:RNA-binding protein
LTSRERARLKADAQKLKPILQIGRDGVTGTTLNAILEAFNQRELIKVKVQQNSPAPAGEVVGAVAQAFPDVEHVQTIGRTIVFWKAKKSDHDQPGPLPGSPQ